LGGDLEISGASTTAATTLLLMLVGQSGGFAALNDTVVEGGSIANNPFSQPLMTDLALLTWSFDPSDADGTLWYGDTPTVWAAFQFNNTTLSNVSRSFYNEWLEVGGLGGFLDAVVVEQNVAVVIIGKFNAVENTDSFVAAAYEPVDAAWASTEGTDQMSFAMFVPAVGTWASNDTADLFRGNGTGPAGGPPPPITGGGGVVTAQGRRIFITG
jgi:hypothetical protein